MSGNRAALRVAFKNARRNKKRTFYLVALVAVPVAVAVLAAGWFRAGHVSQEERALIDFGDANVLVEIYAPIGGTSEWVEQTIHEIDPGAPILVRRNAWQSWGPRTFGALTDTDLGDPLAEGILKLTSGRAPVSSAEVALTEYLAHSLGVGVGDRLAITPAPGVELELEVVGLTSHPVLWRHAEGVVTGETFDEVAGARVRGSLGAQIRAATPDDQRTANLLRSRWLIDRYQFHPGGLDAPLPGFARSLSDDMFFSLSSDQLGELTEVARTQGDQAAMDLAWELTYSDSAERFVVYSELYAQSRTERLQWSTDNPLQTAPAIASAVAAILLVEVAFIAGAAFATGMRRRLREIGLMGSSGADDSHVKATVVGEGLLVGLIGGISGAVVGLVALLAGRPILQGFIERRIEDFPLSLVDMIGPVALAGVACVLAAWFPARSAAGVPTLTALQGRMPAGRPKRWVVVAGVILASLGTLLFTVGLAARSGFADNAVTVLGVVLMIGGVAMLAGPLVAWISKHAERFPLTARIVLRDSGRHRTRAAAAVAATMVIMLLPVIGMLGGNSSIASDSIYGLTDFRPQMVIRGEFSGETGESWPFTPETRGELRDVLGVISGAMGEVATADFLAIEVEVEYPARWEAIRSGEDREDADGWWSSWSVDPARMAIADKNLLRLLDHRRLDEVLTEEGMVLIGMEERRTHVGIAGVDFEVSEVPVVVHHTAFPRVLVTEERAAELGLTPTRAMGVVVSPQNDLNIFGSSFWQPVFDLGLELEMSMSYSGANAMPIALGLMVVATLGVVMIVVATITALSATEADGDLQTMVAVGAENAIRRRYLGLQSFLHTTLGALLAAPLAVLLVKTAVGSGYTYTAVGNFATYDSSRLYVPWLGLAVVVIGIPMLVGLFTALSVRSSPLSPPRRAF